MSFNFPNSPTPGQLFTPVGGYQYVYLDGVWRVVEAPQDVGTAQTRNRIVNGAMQISQENGNTAVGSTGYFADQWFPQWSHDGAVTCQRVQSVTPNGSKDRLRIVVNTADTSLAAAQFQFIQTKIEGTRVADFRYGLASAKQSVLRFGFKGPAGVYSAAITNSAANRSYPVNFTISAGQANADTEQVMIIPGDTTGTWLNDTGVGINIVVCVAGGTAVQGTANTWQVGNFWATAANSNGLGTAGTFELFDVGLYLDPLATGIAPPWVMPDEAEELRACKRYWQKYVVQVPAPGIIYTLSLPDELRTVPAITGGGGGFTVSLGGTSLMTLTQAATATQTLTFNSRM
jgi:hypothetical protein